MSGIPANISNLQHRLELVERELRHAQQLLQAVARVGAVNTAQQVRVVKTYASTPESYPAPPANTFDIRFIDTALNLWSPGTRTPTLTPRSDDAQSIASTLDQRFILPDKICVAALLNEHWWIFEGPGLEYFGRTKSSVGKGGSVTIDILDYDGTKWLNTPFDLEVNDKFLNAEQSLDTKTKVQVRMEYPGKYFIVNALCDADDTDDAEYVPEEE